MSCDPRRDGLNADSWATLDAAIREWWPGDLHTANAHDAADDSQGSLIELPCAYVTPGGSSDHFREMYAWDTYFINRGLLAHGHDEIVRGHIENQLAMIDTYGMVLNGNRTFLQTRSQPPLTAPSLRGYLTRTPDADLARRAIGLLGEEYHHYWSAAHHSTPIGLTTNRDLGDPALRPELSAEAETGQDFTALYEGDVRDFVPLITNSALTATAEALAWMCETWSIEEEARYWRSEAARRAQLMRDYCWDAGSGMFREYNWAHGRWSRVVGLTSLWPLWAGVATTEQARLVAREVQTWLRPNGLPSTASATASPHPEWSHLQWSDPSVWPPEQIIAVDALRRYDLHDLADEVAFRFLASQYQRWQTTGAFWERYHADTSAILPPTERYEALQMHGWSTAAFAVLGRDLFDRAAPYDEVSPTAVNGRGGNHV